MKKNIIAGLDLGTTKVCAVIAEHIDGKINILGFGVAPSEGLHRGLVANISKTAEAIKKAVDDACVKAGFEVTELIVGVAGEHITSLRHRNYVKLNPAERPNLMGVNSTMLQKFYRMARQFHNETNGGFLMVNSAKRSGGGRSAHNFGYAIDVNAMGPDGRSDESSSGQDRAGLAGFLAGPQDEDRSPLRQYGAVAPLDSRAQGLSEPSGAR